MNTILKYSGVVALVILVILGIQHFLPKGQFGSATSCTDGYSCFTNLETQGNSVVDGTSLQVSTTTLSDTVNFNNPGICINFFATSSATRVHITASTTATLPAGAAGVLTFDYGACAL